VTVVSAKTAGQEARGLRLVLEQCKRGNSGETMERQTNATGNDHAEYFVSKLPKTDRFFWLER
jgi:hypothetical protein